MPELLTSLSRSRMFAALLLGLAVLLAAHLLLAPEQVQGLAEKTTALIAAHLVGQGVADHGKEAARAASRTPHTDGERDSSPPPPNTSTN